MKIEQLKAVLFDFDGTLTAPGLINFAAIKEAIRCPSDTAILEFLESCDTEERRRAEEILIRSEAESAKQSKPNENAEDLLLSLKEKNIPFGIITRNSLPSVETAMENFSEITLDDFDIIITRDNNLKTKPHPEGILYACEKLQVDPVNVFVVGDYIFDIEAGNAAGCGTIFLTNGRKKNGDLPCTFLAENIQEVKKILISFIPLPAGKVPNWLLDEYIKKYASLSDYSLVVPPGVGEDVTAVKVDSTDFVLLKADPVTFAAERAGYYAVTINLNDLAAAGGEPKWLLTTLFFPPNTIPCVIETMFKDLSEACASNGITLAGGHTELTPSVTQPIISGMLVGIPDKKIYKKSDIQEGDGIILTKSVSVEGTSILTTDYKKVLMDIGITEEEIQEGQRLINKISILKEARISRNFSGLRAMHDVTEGGLATALREVSISSGHKIAVQEEKIPIMALTKKICSRLNLNAMGLIGSGSLIIVIDDNQAEHLVQKLNSSGIEAAKIGNVLHDGNGLEVTTNGRKKVWPVFDSDEITKV